MSLHGSTTTIKRILLVRTDRLGDVILTLPMLPLLRRCYPEAQISMLLRRYTGEVIEGSPYVDEIIWYDRNDRLVPFEEMRSILRQRKFDASIIVYPRFRLAWLMFQSGIPLRIGTGYRYYSVLFNRKVYEHRKDACRHELEYNLNLLKELPCEIPKDFTPEFYIKIPDEAISKVNALLASKGVLGNDIVIIHPGSGGSAREWTMHNFGELARRLCAEAGMTVLITGSKEEGSKVAEVVRASDAKAVSVAGALRIKELGALIRAARLFISHSTGPLHLAVAMGTPVVGLYPQHTAMSARRWGPFTEKKAVLVPDRPVDCTICFKNKKPCECMATITVDSVYQSATGLMEKVKHWGDVHAR